MKNLRASSTQTVFDLAIQLYGSVDNVFEMIAANEIENVNSDPTGLNVVYEITNDPVQRYFINKGLSVSTKPDNYKNSDEGALELEQGGYLLQQDGYKILL